MDANPSTAPLTPRAAATLALDGRLDGDALLRAVVSWPHWRVRGVERAGDTSRVPVLVTPDGYRVLECFSDEDALRDFEERPDVAPLEGLGDVTVFRGDVLFGALSSRDVMRVSIDQHSPHGLSYQGPRVDELARWAAIARAEAALLDPDRVPDAVRVLVEFEHWHVVLRAGPGSGPASMVLAPDEHRALGAVFSAPDTAAAFVAHATDALPGELRTEIVNGRDLFATLEAMRLDGVVFNPLGPLPARAFHASLFPRVLGLHAHRT